MSFCSHCLDLFRAIFCAGVTSFMYSLFVVAQNCYGSTLSSIFSSAPSPLVNKLLSDSIMTKVVICIWYKFVYGLKTVSIFCRVTF